MGEALDARFAALWQGEPSDEMLRVTASWHRGGPELERFEEASRRTAFPRELGLPGRVLASGESRFVVDIESEENFPRAAPAIAAGLVSAVAFPVRGRRGALASVELLTGPAAPPPAELLDSLITVGSQIGQYLDQARADVAARQSEALTGAVLEAALDCVVVMDHRGRVVEFNRAATEVFGYERSNAIGQEMAELIIPPSLRERHRQGLAHYLATGEGPLLGTRFEITAVRSDGSEFPVELAILPLEVGGAPLFTGYLRDITDRKSAESERAGLLEREHEARLRAERMQRRAAFLAAAGETLASSLDYAQTLQRVAELAVPELADWCVVDVLTDTGSLRRLAVATYDDDKRQMVYDMARRYPVDRTSPTDRAGRVLSSAQAELFEEIPDALLEEVARDPEHLRILREIGLVSAIIVPLGTAGRVLGTMSLAVSESGRRYGEEDLFTAMELARRAATAIDNARLYESRSDIARTLQRSLLPPVLPEIPGLQIAARYRPAGEGNEVGGDFYDLFESDEGCWAVAIGDVSGKGAAAAATTALARYTLRAAGMRESRPSRMLAVLNDALLSQRGPDELCTVALATLSRTGEGVRVTLANAGHPRPLVSRADGSVDRAGEYGTALGVLDELAVTDRVFDLGPGDSIVLYTDGLMDAHAPEVILGEGKLAGLLSACHGLEPGACAERLERSALETSAGEPRDDIAMLVLRVEPAPSSTGQSDKPEHFELRFEGGPGAPAAARHALGPLSNRLGADVLADARLLLGELVTNSVAHGGAGSGDTIEVLLSAADDVLRVEVRDEGPGYEPVPHDPQLGDLSGRGLFLVDEIADRHGVSHDGSRTWFELDIPSTPRKG